MADEDKKYKLYNVLTDMKNILLKGLLSGRMRKESFRVMWTIHLL